MSHTAHALLPVGYALTFIGTVLNLIAVARTNGYEGSPWRAQFVVVGRQHPVLRVVSFACLIAALTVHVSYWVIG